MQSLPVDQEDTEMAWDSYRMGMVARIVKVFPDVGVTHQVSRTQLVKALGNAPLWITQGDKCGRGSYIIPDEYFTAPAPALVVHTPAPVVVEKKSVIEDNNTMPVVAPMSVVENVVSMPAAHKVNVNFIDPSKFIPEKDAQFVPFGNYDNLAKVIKTKQFFPVYLYGESGGGKSKMVEQVCANLGRPMIRINLNAMTDEDQLIGSRTLVNGNIEIVEGPLLIGMRHGMIVLVDEIDCGNPNALMCIQGILEGTQYYFKLKNEVIKPTEGFNIIASGNSNGQGSSDGRYVGVNILNEAFLERFAVHLHQDYPSSAVELKIIMNMMKKLDCIDEGFAKDLVKWADAIRKTYNDGGIDSVVSTRRIVHIIRTFSIFKDKKSAVGMCLQRFDINVRNALIDLFDKVCSDITPEEGVTQSDTPF